MAFITFQPKDYFNTKLYTGNDTAQTITGIPFAPSWVWIKNRSASENHVLVDAVRGANNFISSNTTSSNNTNTEFVKSLTSDGYTLGNADEVNNGSNNFVAMNWKANGQGSSNTDGTINTTYTSVNTTSGFSISTYAGTGSAATVGHGLGAVPKMIIVKRLNGASDWMVYHQSIGNDHRLRLNTTAAKQDNPVWNDTTPTSSVFSMNDNGDVNASGGNYVAYCFADIKGFSKFGSYFGNANANGSFIYLGFKPAFVLVKNTAIADNWSMFNNKALGYNTFNHIMYPDLPNTESNGLPIDFYSNGFKWRTSAAMANGNGQKHIFMAFAESPLVSSNGVPATAR